MNKFFFVILATLAIFVTSCKGYKVENTATVNLAGNWMCVVYYSDGTDWNLYMSAEIKSYNTAANIPSEIWIDDAKVVEGGFKCKIDASNADYSFGKKGTEYASLYNNAGRLIWDGKVSVNAATAPGTGSKVDKIEFFLAFADEAPTAYETVFYIVGYRRTGFPEDKDNFILDFELPEIQEMPTIDQPLP